LCQATLAAPFSGTVADLQVSPGRIVVPDQVALISPQASTVGGDVVYTVVVTLEEQSKGLRVAMSVEVEIETG
jgi:multidrug resistance efflux pump